MRSRLPVLLSVALIFGAGLSQQAIAQPILAPGAAGAVATMRSAAEGPLRIASSPRTGAVSFLGSDDGIPVGLAAGAPAAERALVFLARHGAAFGLPDDAATEVERVAPRDEVGIETVRLRQVHRGIPIAGGEIAVQLRGDRVVAAHAKVVADLVGVSTSPSLTPDDARGIALELVEKYFGADGVELSTPRLEVLDRDLLAARPRTVPVRLAWFVEARRVDLREYLWVDALDGRVLLQFSQLAHVRNRVVRDAAGTSNLESTIVLSEGDSVPVGDTDVDLAYEYAGDTYDHFFVEHGRDSYDDNGAVLDSVVRYCDGACPYQNAFWNGTRMVYGAGFPAADDVVAHELTHAVTEHTAGLFYYMQSGALNESFSDIFGETVDLQNGSGTDTAGVRWLMGEDVPGFGAIRNMMVPNDFDDPAKLSDPFLVCADPGGDKGGVHTNSGIPNHLYALLVDGGTFNGQAVSGVGLTKAAKIHYRVLAHYLLSASDFADHAAALAQACTDLIGTAGITGTDCSQLDAAIAAVEIADPFPCSAASQSSVGPLCPAGQVAQTLFFDDLESGTGNWSTSSTHNPVAPWIGEIGFASSGTAMLYGPDPPRTGFNRVAMNVDVAIPTGAFLQFEHAFGFENQSTTYWDGGVVERSVDGGTNWTDAGALIAAGAAYNGVIRTGTSNPLAGRSGFGGDSHGYTTSRLDLATLAGQSVRFAWSVGSDNFAGDLGWLVDDVHLYQCVDPLIFEDDFESGGTTAWAAKVP